MTVVTYRGVKYDADARRAQPLQTIKVEKTYRGIKHIGKVEVAK